MSGERGAVAKGSSQVQPRAVCTHCYGHALNLVVTDTNKLTNKEINQKMMRVILHRTHAITKLLNVLLEEKELFFIR